MPTPAFDCPPLTTFQQRSWSHTSPWMGALALTLFALCLGGIFAASVDASEQRGSGASAADKPNVVLFFIDDLGYMDLGCYGSTGYLTPRIDKLAQRSVRFTDFYSANPVCSPTRAALMSGKAPHRVGITQWINQPSELHLPLSETTVGEAFAEAGYRTGYLGKWHLGEKDQQMPNAQGFEWMKCVNRAGAPGSYFYPFRRKSKDAKYHAVPDLQSYQQGDYLNDAMTDQAISFITEHQKQPFFLCFAHYAVHTPIQAPPERVEHYRRKFAQLPKLKTPSIKERNEGRSRVRQDNPTYAAMMENLDHNVGRILDHLKRSGLEEKTIIVFTSDNGGLSTLRNVGPTSCLPLRAGKGWTYEGGIRIPTMISWPAKIKPATCDLPGITMDLYPTLLELSGLPLRPKQHLDGVSLVAALEGTVEPAVRDRFLAWTYPHKHGSQHTPSNAIRVGPWKLIQKTDDRTAADDRIELYNLANDVSETKNLVKSHPEKAAELLDQLTNWLQETRPQSN